MTLYFYRAHGPYGCFSNFSRHGLESDDYWGCGVDAYGQNRLGQIPCEVCARLRGSA
jgi:predicted NAD-dependent protein-ADP-ribosyltransferase YbiA (DUF1768 family)